MYKKINDSEDVKNLLKTWTFKGEISWSIALSAIYTVKGSFHMLFFAGYLTKDTNTKDKYVVSNQQIKTSLYKDLMKIFNKKLYVEKSDSVK